MQMRRRAITTVIAALALVVGVLAGASPASATDHDPGAHQGVTAEQASLPWFEGAVGDFYVVPEQLPDGDVGTLVRVQTISSSETSTTLRIMYLSRDRNEQVRAVTGRITYPNTPAPEGGRPVVSHANGTVGLAAHCALSRGTGSVSSLGLDAVAVASDYIGMGPVGERHSYLSRVSEGRAVIDAVRAARNIPDAQASSRWLTIGNSQGGHGTLAANELGAEYAPELDLLGAVAMAPAAMLDRTYGLLDQAVAGVVSVMGLYGLATEHPELIPQDYVRSSSRASIENAITNGCTGDVTNTVAPMYLFGGPFSSNPITTEPARSIVLENDVGHVAVDSPVLLLQGTADPIVPPARTADLYARMCGVGQSTEHVLVQGADHGNVVQLAFDQIHSWMQARIDGDPALSTCPGQTGPFTARFTSQQCQSLDAIGAALETDRAGVVRVGVDIIDTLPVEDFTPVPNEGTCAVTVDWGPDDLARVQAIARRWGADLATLHDSGGRIVLQIVYLLAISGQGLNQV